MLYKHLLVIVNLQLFYTMLILFSLSLKFRQLSINSNSAFSLHFYPKHRQLTSFCYKQATFLNWNYFL